MTRRKGGGNYMLKTLDIDTNVTVWVPAFNAAKRGEVAQCPRCGSKDTKSLVHEFDNGVGFITVTCKSCGKTGYISRVVF